MFNFEKLETWRDAISFADLIYQFTRLFPTEERFGLTNQMRRVALRREVREKTSPLLRAHLARMPLTTPHDEAADPIHVSFLRARRHLFEAQHLPALVEEAQLGIGHKPAEGPSRIGSIKGYAH